MINFARILSLPLFLTTTSLTGITSSFTIAEDIKIESLEVVFDTTHTYRGNLEIALTSPAGTQSILETEPLWDCRTTQHLNF